MRIKLKQVVRQLLQNTQKLQIKWFIRNSVRSFQLTQMATQFQMRQLHNIRMIQTIQLRVAWLQHQSSQVMWQTFQMWHHLTQELIPQLSTVRQIKKQLSRTLTKQQVKPLPMIKSVVNQVRLLTTQLRTRSSTMKIVVMFSLAMSSQQVLTSITMRQSIKHGQ